MITDMKENANLFETLVFDNIHRDGISSFMNYLIKQTDFFSSPASIKYHGSFAGGLLAHSLEVYYQIRKLSPIYGYCRNESEIESATLVSLFHDVCKINSYVTSVRNVKNSSGNWESVPCYIYSDKKDFGAHGAESIYILTQHLLLTRDETVAIYHHMGAWDASKYDNPSQAYESTKLAWLLHVADEAATYIAGI